MLVVALVVLVVALVVLGVPEVSPSSRQREEGAAGAEPREPPAGKSKIPIEFSAAEQGINQFSPIPSTEKTNLSPCQALPT